MPANNIGGHWPPYRLFGGDHSCVLRFRKPFSPVMRRSFGCFRSWTNSLGSGASLWENGSKSGLLDVLERLVEAAYSRHKEGPLRQANLRLEVVRHVWRMAHELKVVSTRQYEHGAKLIDDLGRQIGGWLRSQAGAPPTA